MTEASDKINEPSSPQLEAKIKEKQTKIAENNAATMNPEIDDQAFESL